MKSYIALILVVLCAAVLLAQSPVPAPQVQSPQVGRTFEDEFACPTSPTVITTVNTWVQWATVSTNGSSNTITIQNGQGSPLVWMNAVPIAANTLYTIPLPPKGKLSRSGLTLSCASAGAVVYITYWVR